MSTETQTATPADVREWARSSGWPVGTRGRLSAEVKDAYAAATAAATGRRLG